MSEQSQSLEFVPHPDLPPPASTVGVIGWLRRNLFSSPSNTVLTIVSAYIIYVTVPPFLDWAIFSANWNAGTSRADCSERWRVLDYGARQVWSVSLRILSNSLSAGVSI